MGEARVKLASNKKTLNKFMHYLLDDVRALDKMLTDDVFEKGITRIGAEQEVCLVDEHWKPSPCNLELLEQSTNPLFTSELAKFNFEMNLDPLVFEGNCLSEMERAIDAQVEEVRSLMEERGGDVVLSGIMYTIRKFDLDIENLTPLERYKALVTAINNMRGDHMELRLKGLDELILKHDSPLLEACNTGFQVHLQVDPKDFVHKYNIAQALTAPVMALGTNSPMLFGKRLWSETRIALFQQSIDTRTTSEHLRERSPRVMFGNDWLHNSILEIYKEDIARFRVLLSSEEFEDSMKTLNNGGMPKLGALQVHNSTVYRWNRPCYGVAGGVPHLRIENRILPAGPSVLDEVANATFWLGLMQGYAKNVPDIRERMDFDHASSNFVSACRMGVDTKMRWFDGKRYAFNDLVKNELLPIAKEGLEEQNIDKADIDRYLGVIEARNETGMTGSTWAIDSYSKLVKEGSKEGALIALTASTVEHQKSKKPVHEWPLASFEDVRSWDPASMLVEEFMTTDVFTVQKDDILPFVSDMMDWRQIRYMPVENDAGELIGLVTLRLLLRHFSQNRNAKSSETVKDVMKTNPLTIHPEATIREAMEMMKANKVGCLPVLKNNKLVGIVTEEEYIKITQRLIKRFVLKKSVNKPA